MEPSPDLASHTLQRAGGPPCRSSQRSSESSSGEVMVVFESRDRGSVGFALGEPQSFLGRDAASLAAGFHERKDISSRGCLGMDQHTWVGRIIGGVFG